MAMWETGGRGAGEFATAMTSATSTEGNGMIRSPCATEVHFDHAGYHHLIIRSYLYHAGL